MKNIKPKMILLILALTFLFLGFTVSKAYVNKLAFEKDVLSIADKNQETIFSINNITLFSSADCDSEIKSNTSLNIKDLYQYTDIAIFIDPNSDSLTPKNTLKEVYIDNINFPQKPEEGTPNLYYKNINNFATSSHQAENKIDSKLNFNVTSEDNADLNTPTLYNNCANPITLSYVNDNIKTDYTLADAFSGITYDGSLLKNCSIPLSSIKATVSFDIHIKNNQDQSFICPVCINIPLEQSDGSSIYDGKLLVKNPTNYTFYRTN